VREGFSLFDLTGRSAGGRLPKAGLGIIKGVTTGRSDRRELYGFYPGDHLWWAAEAFRELDEALRDGRTDSE
jgi:hypothetical protein